jgi:low affinity Fe/Cu permease
MLRALCRLAAATPNVVGSPWAFLLAVGAILGWIATGALFDWSSGWVLWPATATSIGAFLLVLLLQYSQNRDTRALQLKLDEVIRALEQARTHLVRLEHLSDEELDQLEDEFRRLGEDEAA